MADETKPTEEVVDPVLNAEENDELIEDEKPEPKPEEKGRETEKDAVAAYAKAAEETEKAAKPVEAKEIDRTDWQFRTVQDFRELTDQTSTMFQVQQEKLRVLRSQNYQGADIDYLAAKLAHDDPRVARGRNEERSRERRADEAARFEPPSSRRTPETPTAKLSPRGEEIASQAGIKRPEAKARLAANLAKIAQKYGG